MGNLSMGGGGNLIGGDHEGDEACQEGGRWNQGWKQIDGPFPLVCFN